MSNTDLIYPPEYVQQQDSLDRRRALAQALMQKSVQGRDPLATAGKYVVPYSMTEGLTQLAQALMAGKANANVDREQKGLSAQQQAYRDALIGRMSDGEDSLRAAGEVDPKGLADYQIKKRLPQPGMGDPSNVREWEYFNSLPPDDQQRYLEMRRSQKTVDLGGSIGVLGSGGQIAREYQKKLPPQDQPANLEAQAAAKAAGQATGEREGNAQKKAVGANNVLQLLDDAETIIPKSTGSYGGAAMDAAARFVGKSTEGAQSAAQLNVIEGALISQMPRMEGPQSNADALLYRQAAAQIGDPTVPRETKISAIGALRKIQERYANPQGSAQQPAGQTKTVNGVTYVKRDGKWFRQ